MTIQTGQHFEAAGEVDGPRGPWSSEGSLIEREGEEEEEEALESVDSDIACSLWEQKTKVREITVFLNCVDRPSITRLRFFANTAVTFVARLVQEETIKIGFSCESVRKQEVFASRKTRSYWCKKGTTPTSHKIIWQNT